MAPGAEVAEANGDAGVGGAPYRILSFDIGVKNLACCVLELDRDPTLRAPTAADAGTESARVLFWTVFSLAAEKERIPSVNELAGRLFTVMDRLVADLESVAGVATLDMVLLENQPSRLNGAMKSLQMMLYSYFQLRRHWEGRAAAVQMVSAGKKTQGHDCEIATPESCGYKPKKGYALNKWNAIQIAQKYISGDADLEKLFATHKKKDDLSDALCQALAWVRRHGYRVAEGCVKNDIKDLCGGH
jgi:hypothetical protein